MSGTRAGGMKAYLTNIQKHGIDFYKNIGRKGGLNGHTGGFTKENSEFARQMGRIGGLKRQELLRARKAVKEMYDTNL